MASNASIPLPVPVRTRSGRGGSESGYSSDAYNHMTIRRLERDTSVDRLSTGKQQFFMINFIGIEFGVTVAYRFLFKMVNTGFGTY